VVKYPRPLSSNVRMIMTTLDSCDTLYLDAVHYDHEENTLTIVTTEGISSNIECDVKLGDKILPIRAKPIKVTDKSKRYSINFSSVLSHFVMNDFYQNLLGPDDIFTGKNLLVLEKNGFIDFIAHATLIPQILDANEVGYYCLITASAQFFVCAEITPKVTLL